MLGRNVASAQHLVCIAGAAVHAPRLAYATRYDDAVGSIMSVAHMRYSIRTDIRPSVFKPCFCVCSPDHATAVVDRRCPLVCASGGRRCKVRTALDGVSQSLNCARQLFETLLFNVPFLLDLGIPLCSIHCHLLPSHHAHRSFDQTISSLQQYSPSVFLPSDVLTSVVGRYLAHTTLCDGEQS